MAKLTITDLAGTGGYTEELDQDDHLEIVVAPDGQACITVIRTTDSKQYMTPPRKLDTDDKFGKDSIDFDAIFLRYIKKRNVKQSFIGVETLVSDGIVMDIEWRDGWKYHVRLLSSMDGEEVILPPDVPHGSRDKLSSGTLIRV